MENSMAFPQKFKNRTTIWSSSSSLGYISEGSEITILKWYLHPHVHCSIIYNSQDMETTGVSTDGWQTGKENAYMYINNMYIIDRMTNNLTKK